MMIYSDSVRVAHRRGAVLLIVLVIVVLLALGAYTFCETMISEREATAMFGRQVETRALADSGVEYAAAVLGRKADIPYETFYDRPDLFQGVLLRPSDRPRGRGRFSIAAAAESDPAARSLRFGVTDESGKLNLNLVTHWERENLLTEDEAREILNHLPEMTHDTADAILDWLDDDQLPRRYGAESEFYQKLARPYRPKNGPLDTLDELLLVRGVTPALLFGEDTDRNGLLDPNEDDGDASPPVDNADATLQRGWAAYLTLHGRESNLRADGRKKIDLNQESLGQLFEQLAAEFGDDIAALVVEYRRESEDVVEPGQSRAAGDTGAPAGDTGAPAGDDELQTPPGQNRISSVYDLIDAEIAASSDGTRPAVKSPWTSDPNQMRRYLPKLLDSLSTHGRPFIEGRVNINVAPREVLLGVPGMTEALADAIVARQAILVTGRPSASVLATHSTTAWLLIEGLVDLPTMRQLDRYVTARGDVYRIQSLGYFDAGGPVTRLEAVIDATWQPPRVVMLRDLTDLGRGYVIGLEE